MKKKKKTRVKKMKIEDVLENVISSFVLASLAAALVITTGGIVVLMGSLF